MNYRRRHKTFMLIIADISQLVSEQACLPDGQPLPGNGVIPVIVCMSENPVANVGMVDNEIIHIDEEPAVQAAPGMAVEGGVHCRAVMGDDDLVIGRRGLDGILQPAGANLVQLIELPGKEQGVLVAYEPRVHHPVLNIGDIGIRDLAP